mmetsp:Transcript_10048/g.29784  ORF Transcript_10048/g.29784 Transcript_10048/m.29784 type:complete len:1189 (-) Transcript_10048:81-3647(-)
MRWGWHARTGMTGVLHRKLLKVSSAALRGHNDAKAKHIKKKKAAMAGAASVYNLISSDTDRFDSLAPFLHFGWVSICEFIALTAFLVQRVGPAAGLGATGSLILAMALQTRIGKALGKRRRKTARLSDRRVRTTSEVIGAMATVKAYAWEAPFSSRINALRADEAGSIRRSQQMKAVNLAMQAAAPSVAGLIAFGVYVGVQGNELSAANAYATVALIAALREIVGRHFPRFIEFWPEMVAAVMRMEKFMLLPDVQAFTSVDKAKVGNELLRVDGASFYWPGSSIGAAAGAAAPEEEPLTEGAADTLALDRVTVYARRGELTMVNGAVGSGKTALLSAVLGELRCTEPGRVTVAGSLGYCPQEPWILSGSLRSNVLFNAPYDAERFERVLTACALDVDAAQLPDGVHTEIGEKGVNLSGGQKARVSLARACYAGADLVLLDDPLAAVDPEVAAHLFRACVLDWLLRDCGAAVVLVTHQEQFEPYANTVLRLAPGGATEALVSQTPQQFSAAEARQRGRAPSEEERASWSESRPRRGDAGDGDKGGDGGDGDGSGPTATTVKLVQKEERELGEVKLSTWLAYIRACGPLVFSAAFFMMALGQASLMATDYYLKVWTEADDQRDGRIIGIYGALCGVTFVLAFARTTAFFRSTLRASSALHDGALRSVLQAPLYFFAATPLGRILNRFSSDLNQTDELLAMAMYDTAAIALASAGAVILGCIVMPWLALLMPFVLYVFVRVRNFATRSMRELKRMDNIHKSPVYSSFASALAGVVPIRAYGRQDETDAQFQERLEAGARPWFWWLVANRWIGFNLDMLVSVIVAALAFLVVALRDSLDPALAGFALAYIIGLGGVFQYMVRMSALVETYMSSTERLVHYATQLPQEAVAVDGDEADVPLAQTDANGDDDADPEDGVAVDAAGVRLLDVAAAWPPRGGVKIRDLKVRYRSDLPTVLKGIDVDIPAGAKVGVCGRTGSGKSSMLLSLARLNEVEAGTIAIDGVDTGRVPLQRLRRGLAVIPQEPHLFSGTLRFNMDPFAEYTDADIEDALRTVSLGDAADGAGGDDAAAAALSLTSKIEEAGSNLSQGQRQLLSLARALLRRRRLVLLDEATAAVDFATDARIQKALREAEGFRGATCVIIAHRVRTIIDADLIIVLDDGRVAEVGPPEELRNRPGGVFAAMVKESELQHAEA